MRSRFASFAAALSVALVATLTSAKDSGAAVLFFDDFNSEDAEAQSQSTFANWTVSGGFVDVIGTGSYDFYPGHGNYVDLNGSTGVNGALKSNTMFGAGTYTLTFHSAAAKAALATSTPSPKRLW